ncbi:DUF5682 family protein [Micromonospora sp. LOL_023]|uniref:DUF5682 family protein n=1 Tax=Micromonospora sp. LOL_023 TaxID=3345418 RepID=UPI003A87179C
MAVTVVGVRHHSPACARLVAETIAAQRPAYVLVEGPAEMNGRLDELLLDHELPVAVLTSYRDPQRRYVSWTPFCAYSPEWVALTAGRQVGAELRFIDLPAWHPAFTGRRNRYADAEHRYAEVTRRLCRTFGVDTVDALWDHLFEIPPTDDLAERLASYFDLLRYGSTAGPHDTEREEYMAQWIRAAVNHAGSRPVVVVTGGFHRPALVRLAAATAHSPGSADPAWPQVPGPPATAVGDSYLVPYSFRRLDAFDAEQSGMPSPDYYQRLWDHGPDSAADHVVASVVGRLRRQRQAVSTADLIAARASASGLARMRGHRHLARVDILDGLASALVTEALDGPLPWSQRGSRYAGTHPAVVEMVNVLTGDRVGRLHPSTPLPPLVHHAEAELERHGFDEPGDVRLVLTDRTDLDRSRVLHQLRVLRVPGFTRHTGPATGIDPVLDEQWSVRVDDNRLPGLIEAGGYGRTLDMAAAAVLAEQISTAHGDLRQLSAALFDAALCGDDGVSDDTLRQVTGVVGSATGVAPVGRLLAVALALWRHDHLLAPAGNATVGTVVAAAVRRVLWLAESVRGATATADPARIDALVAVRDALTHARSALGLDRDAALAVAARIAANTDAPPDLRGAAFGLTWSLGARVEPARAVRGAFVPASAGDWLAGLFALAREEVLAASGVLDLLDDLIVTTGEQEFLTALPALRQAFAYFPPREREIIARHVLARRGVSGSARELLRLPVAPAVVAAGRALDERIDALLRRSGLVTE